MHWQLSQRTVTRPWRRGESASGADRLAAEGEIPQENWTCRVQRSVRQDEHLGKAARNQRCVRQAEPTRFAGSLS